jgi:hypothetical protein
MDKPLPNKFTAYEIHGLEEVELGVFEMCLEPENAQSWCLYGHVVGEGLHTIGTFTTREEAEDIYARITGMEY